MIIPRELMVKSYATWDSARVRLDTPGITFVRGNNLDDLHNPNATGKSSLFNAGRAMVWGQHQLSPKKNSVGKIVEAATIIQEKFTIDDREVVAKMKGNRLNVTVDGEQVEAARKSAERERLHQMLGINQELWDATVHVNGIAANPLLRGTSASRCLFLEKAFDLDRWSQLHVKMGEIISQMKRADDELDRTKAELASLGDVVDIEKLEARREHLASTRKKVEHLLGVANNIMGRINDLGDKPESTVEELQTKIRVLEAKVANASKNAAAYALWEQAITQRKKLKAEMEKLSNSVKDVVLPSPITRDSIDDWYEKASKVVEQWSEAANNLEVVKVWYALAKTLAKEHNIQYSDIHELYALSKGWVRNWKSGQDVCAVCGSRMKRVDGSVLKRLAASLEAEFRPFNPRDMPDITAAKKQLHNLSLLRGRLKENNEIKRRLKDLREQYRTIEMPSKRPASVDVSSLAKHLDDHREQLAEAKRWQRAGRYAGMSVSDLKAKITKLKSTNEKAIEAFSQVDGTLRLAKSNQERRKELQARVSTLEQEVALRPIYKSLQMAYSPNGMRLWLLQELLESLVAGLNANSHQTRDHRVYGYRLSRNRDLALTASTNKGTFDLYMLSGAESSLFTLNLLVTLLPMLPASRRSSMLILDELDSNCSTRSKDIILDVYLPKLKKIVDTIFVITPNTSKEFSIPNCHELMVTKRNTVSSLEVLS